MGRDLDSNHTLALAKRPPVASLSSSLASSQMRNYQTLWGGLGNTINLAKNQPRYRKLSVNERKCLFQRLFNYYSSFLKNLNAFSKGTVLSCIHFTIRKINGLLCLNIAKLCLLVPFAGED